ncbi:hypothetical protein AAVH_19771 [Aphelenchoides avenae]|nr:hypothetical protein AAVH_19771 [Aphelenchus avenae]
MKDTFLIFACLFAALFCQQLVNTEASQYYDVNEDEEPGDPLKNYKEAVRSLRERLWNAGCDVRRYSQRCIFSPMSCVHNVQAPIPLLNPCRSRPIAGNVLMVRRY